jgi:hypothetical protein
MQQQLICGVARRLKWRVPFHRIVRLAAGPHLRFQECKDRGIMNFLKQLRFSRSLLIGCGVLLVSCGGPPPEVTPALVARAQRQSPGVTAESLERGRQVLLTKCTACHGVRQPADYSPTLWRGYIREMGPKALLDDGQAAELLRYVLTAQEAK